MYKGALATVLTFEGPSFETARHIILQLCMHMQKIMHVHWYILAAVVRVRVGAASTLDACTVLAFFWLLNAKEKESCIIKIVVICTDHGGNPRIEEILIISEIYRGDTLIHGYPQITRWKTEYISYYCNINVYIRIQLAR